MQRPSDLQKVLCVPAHAHQGGQKTHRRHKPRVAEQAYLLQKCRARAVAERSRFHQVAACGCGLKQSCQLKADRLTLTESVSLSNCGLQVSDCRQRLHDKLEAAPWQSIRLQGLMAADAQQQLYSHVEAAQQDCVRLQALC